MSPLRIVCILLLAGCSRDAALGPPTDVLEVDVINSSSDAKLAVRTGEGGVGLLSESFNDAEGLSHRVLSFGGGSLIRNASGAMRGTFAIILTDGGTDFCQPQLPFEVGRYDDGTHPKNARARQGIFIQSHRVSASYVAVYDSAGRLLVNTNHDWPYGPGEFQYPLLPCN